MAEGHIHVAAVELAGEAAAVERSDGVGAAGSRCVRGADGASIKRGRQWLPVQVASFGVVLCAQEVSEKHQDIVKVQHRAL